MRPETYVVDDIVEDIIKDSDCLREAVSNLLIQAGEFVNALEGKLTNCCIEEGEPSPVAMTMPAGWKVLSSDILNYAVKTRLSE